MFLSVWGSRRFPFSPCAYNSNVCDISQLFACKAPGFGDVERQRAFPDFGRSTKRFIARCALLATGARAPVAFPFYRIVMPDRVAVSLPQMSALPLINPRPFRVTCPSTVA